jgi:predicted dithiol-disulfide oxidoreductase (DUF899 family)
MNLPKIVSHDQWLVARKRLLAKEKDSNSTERPRRRADRLGTIVRAIHEHTAEAR